MATLLARLKVHPGKEAEFEKTIRPLYEATHRLEPGCRRYEYLRGTTPGTYYVMLSFDDFMAFMTHQASPHHEAPDFPALLAEIDLEWLDSVEGACDLPPSNPQAVPADASELVKTYARNHAFTVPDWWNRLR
jgi:quinol monooxygenase YgiN